MDFRASMSYEHAWNEYRKRRRTARLWGRVAWAAALLLCWPGLLGWKLAFFVLLAAGTFNVALGARVEAFHCPHCGKLFRGFAGLRSVANIMRSKCGYCGIGVGESPDLAA